MQHCLVLCPHRLLSASLPAFNPNEIHNPHHFPPPTSVHPIFVKRVCAMRSERAPSSVSGPIIVDRPTERSCNRPTHPTNPPSHLPPLQSFAVRGQSALALISSNPVGLLSTVWRFGKTQHVKPRLERHQINVKDDILDAGGVVVSLLGSTHAALVNREGQRKRNKDH